MAREECEYARHYDAVLRALTTRGLLLGTYDDRGEPNVMTIGWGTLGSVWSRPIWIVLVRPSRYSHGSIDRSGCFTVNVPGPELAEVCEICGSASGRDTDKFARCALTAERASKVQAPLVKECPIVYECRVVHANDVLAPTLADDIRRGAYRGGDFHRCYWGEIVAVRAVPDPEARLG